MFKYSRGSQLRILGVSLRGDKRQPPGRMSTYLSNQTNLQTVAAWGLTCLLSGALYECATRQGLLPFKVAEKCCEALTWSLTSYEDDSSILIAAIAMYQTHTGRHHNQHEAVQLKLWLSKQKLTCRVWPNRKLGGVCLHRASSHNCTYAAVRTKRSGYTCRDPCLHDKFSW